MSDQWLYYYYGFEVGPDGWVSSGSEGDCELYPDLEGHNPVTWTLDPTAPAPTATSTKLHLLVTELTCASGKPVLDRLLAPAIVYEPSGVFITFASVPLPGDAQDCQGNPSSKVMIQLREPLGDRTLRGWVPPPEGSGG